MHYAQWFVCVLLIAGFTGCKSSQSRVIDRALSNAERKLDMPLSRRDYFPLYMEVTEWLGTPYRHGGRSKSGADCSGFVSSVVEKAYGKKIERSTRDQLKKSVRRVHKHALREGDLVFFTSKGSKGNATHVGIYLKNKKFAHASSSRGVMVSSLHEDYWHTYWLCGGRIK